MFENMKGIGMGSSAPNNVWETMVRPEEVFEYIKDEANEFFDHFEINLQNFLSKRANGKERTRINEFTANFNKYVEYVNPKTQFMIYSSYMDILRLIFPNQFFYINDINSLLIDKELMIDSRLEESEKDITKNPESLSDESSISVLLEKMIDDLQSDALDTSTNLNSNLVEQKKKAVIRGLLYTYVAMKNHPDYYTNDEFRKTTDLLKNRLIDFKAPFLDQLIEKLSAVNAIVCENLRPLYPDKK